MSLSRFLPRLISRTSLIGRMSASALPKPQTKFRDSSVLLLSQPHQFEKTSDLLSCSRSFSTTFPCLEIKNDETSVEDDLANLPEESKDTNLAKLLRDQEVSYTLRESIMGLFDSIPEACLKGLFDSSAPLASDVPRDTLNAYLSELGYCKDMLNIGIVATEGDLRGCQEVLKSYPTPASKSSKINNERVRKLNERVFTLHARISLLNSALIEVETEIFKFDSPHTTPSIKPRIEKFDPVSLSNIISEHFDGERREYETLLKTDPEAAKNFPVTWKESCATPNNLSDDVFEAEADDQFLDEVFGLVAKRQNYFLDSSFCPSKFFNLLIALHSPPGGGKSFSLDSIAKFAQNPTNLQQFLNRNPGMFRLPRPSNAPRDQEPSTINKDPLLIPRCFQHPIGLTITHIQNQGPLAEEDSEDSIDEITGWRILHSYFANFKSLNLRKFITMFRNRDAPKLTAIEALYAVLHHARETFKKTNPGKKVPEPHIFLCVDEIMDNKHTDRLITFLGEILDRFLNVSVFVSTLNSHYVFNKKFNLEADPQRPDDKMFVLFRMRTNSLRQVDWATVKPIPMPQVIKLFEKKGLKPRQKPCLYAALCMANGHPRTLQGIFVAAKRGGIPINGAPLDFIKNIDIAAHNPLTPPLVRLALIGKEVDANLPCEIPGAGGRLFGEFLTNGFFLNSINPKKTTKFVPTLSLIRLYSHFLEGLDKEAHIPLELAKDVDSSPSDNPDPTKELLRWISLHKILQVTFPIPSSSSVSHSDYLETFHGYWEDTKRVAFVGDEKEKISFLIKDFYGVPHEVDIVSRSNSLKLESEGALLFGKDVRVLMKPNFIGPIKTLVTLNEKEIARYLTKGFGADASDHNSRTRSSSGSVLSRKGGKKPPPKGSIFDVIIKPKESNNKGFDLVLFEKTVLDPADPTQLGDPVVIFIECKSTMTRDIEEKNSLLRSGESSQPSYLTPKMILNKVESCVKQFKANIQEHDETKGKKSGAPGFTKLSQMFVVFVSTQRVSKETFEAVADKLEKKYGNSDPSEQPNVVIIPKERLLELYTPTLSDTPAFLDHEEIEQDRN